MPKQVEAEFLKRTPSKRLIVGVAIDGSTLSDKALHHACSLVQKDRGDRLVILHVADSRYAWVFPWHCCWLLPAHTGQPQTTTLLPASLSLCSKAYLPRHLQPKHLENAYTSKAFDFKVGCCCCCCCVLARARAMRTQEAACTQCMQPHKAGPAGPAVCAGPCMCETRGLQQSQ